LVKKKFITGVYSIPGISFRKHASLYKL